jgi:hypothetical protein
MRKIMLVTFLLCSQIGFADRYQFPFTRGDLKWKEYNSANSRKAALQIPEDILKDLSTKDLIDVCIDYPYLFDMTLYDDMESALDNICREFNGLKELLERENLIDELLTKYSSIPLLSTMVSKESAKDKATFSIQCATLRYIICHKTIYDRMSEEQKKKFFSDAAEDLQAMYGLESVFIGQYDFPHCLFSQENTQSLYAFKRLQQIRDNAYNMVTRYTPHLSEVDAGILIIPDFDEETKIYYKNYIESAYDGAVVIGDASMRYNCHAYAWHIYEGGDSVWIGVSSPDVEDIYWEDSSYIEVPDSLSTKVSYTGNHSAVRISDTVFVSKWGRSPLVRHSPENTPGYGSPSKYYKRYSPHIEGVSSIINSQTYTIPNCNSCLNVTWSIDNSAFTLVPSGSQCTVLINTTSQYQEATLTAVISRNGHNLYTISKSILFQKPSLYVEGIQYEYTSSSGMYPEQTFTINVPNALNGYSSDSICVNTDCDISLVSDRFRGMNISFEGNLSLLPTDVYCIDDFVDFHLQNSSTPYTLILKAQKEGGYYDFNLNFTVSPIPELYQMYYEDDPELVLNLSGNALNILLTNVQGTELGGGLIQQATWYLRIYRAQTGAQVYSQTIHAPFTDVYVNNYANGLYIVTAIYNGNTYHAKVYINH